MERKLDQLLRQHEAFLLFEAPPEDRRSPPPSLETLLKADFQLRTDITRALADGALPQSLAWKKTVAQGTGGLLESLVRDCYLQLTYPRHGAIPQAPITRAQMRAAFQAYGAAVGAYLKELPAGNDIANCAQVLYSLVRAGTCLARCLPRGEAGSDPFGGLTLFRAELARFRPSAAVPYATILEITVSDASTIHRVPQRVIQTGNLLRAHLNRTTVDFSALVPVMINFASHCVSGLRMTSHGLDVMRHDMGEFYSMDSKVDWKQTLSELQQREKLLLEVDRWLEGDYPPAVNLHRQTLNLVTKGMLLANAVRRRSILFQTGQARDSSLLGEPESRQLAIFFRELLEFLDTWATTGNVEEIHNNAALFELKVVAEVLQGPLQSRPLNGVDRQRLTTFLDALKRRSSRTSALVYEAALLTWKSGRIGDGDERLRHNLNELELNFKRRKSAQGGR